MLRSMFSGVSGLRAHQTMMDVVGNNIANVNTTGFKASQVVFQDTLSQMIRAAGAPQGAQGGSNPAQVGLGVRVGGVTGIFTQGATQLTGRSTDMAIQGDGFFAVRRGTETLYTRGGAFSFDANGTVVTPDGAVVRGWRAENGVIDPNRPLTDLQLPLGTLLPPKRTESAKIGGNLPNNATVGTQVVKSMTLYDGQGKEYPVTFTTTYAGKVAGPPAVDRWTFTASDGTNTIGSANLDFRQVDGTLVNNPPSVTLTPVGNGWSGNAVAVDIAGLTQFGQANTVEPQSQDGAAMGSLQTFTLSPDGTLVGHFSNGLKQPLGQVALATFNNPAGLERVGDTMFRDSVNSGAAQLGVAGGGGRGSLVSGSLEMSNVDLAQEFTTLITAQRGFQANSKIITASDEILQDLVNLKR